MRYELLGPLRIVTDQSVILIKAPKIETVLRVLLVRANQIVSTTQLISEIWGDRPPRRATAAVHVYISNIRSRLGMGNAGSTPITTRPPGYIMSLSPEDLDLTRFRRLARQGRRMMFDGLYEEASQAFDDALALWRAPMGPVGEGPIMSGFCTAVEEIRLECVEHLVEASLRLGRHRSTVSELYQLVSEYPFHEAFHGQLMRALYESNRRAEALRVYSDLRRILNSELGLDPGPALRALQHAVLTDTVEPVEDRPIRTPAQRTGGPHTLDVRSF
jgi:DNA-binding SARP family transcriptional activator